MRRSDASKLPFLFKSELSSNKTIELVIIKEGRVYLHGSGVPIPDSGGIQGCI